MASELKGERLVLKTKDGVDQLYSVNLWIILTSGLLKSLGIVAQPFVA